MIDFEVVTEHPEFLIYVDYLQRKNAESLSFYPLQVFEREMAKGRVLLGLLNNAPCGYIYMGAANLDMKVHQVCIQFDLRRKLYGAHLVGEAEKIANLGGCRTITLRCGFDLDANDFWRDLNYKCVNVVDGGVRRMRKINIWRKWLQAPLLKPEETVPAKGKIDVSLWRRNKENGLLTQFHRGKALDDYRELLKAKDVKKEDRNETVQSNAQREGSKRRYSK
tara:strand:- start:2125 stop:2790 length:666 start_codon:yes stop_codon:yes gene_type:complete